MPKATKIDDRTVGICDVGLPCCPHQRSGTNATSSPTVFINGKAAHRVGDTGPTNCPHAGEFVSTEGSPTVFVNGIPITRIGDETICEKCGEKGNHSTGSETVFVN